MEPGKCRDPTDDTSKCWHRCHDVPCFLYLSEVSPIDSIAQVEPRRMRQMRPGRPTFERTSWIRCWRSRGVGACKWGTSWRSASWISWFEHQKWWNKGTIPLKGISWWGYRITWTISPRRVELAHFGMSLPSKPNISRLRGSELPEIQIIHTRWCPSSLAKLVYNSNNYGLW